MGNGPSRETWFPARAARGSNVDASEPSVVQFALILNFFITDSRSLAIVGLSRSRPAIAFSR